MKSLAPCLMLAALLLVGCEPNGGTGGLPEPVCVSSQGTPAPDFVGLDEEEAFDLAEARDLQVRVVGRDGECLAVTMDLREDRVNLEYVGEVVVGAAIY